MENWLRSFSYVGPHNAYELMHLCFGRETFLGKKLYLLCVIIISIIILFSVAYIFGDVNCTFFV